MTQAQLSTTDTFIHIIPLVDTYINEIGVAFRAVRRDLSESHPSGELQLTLSFSTRMDAEDQSLTVPKIGLRFYHYQSYSTSLVSEGLEWSEVVTELFRLLRRDARLKQITKRMED